MQTSIVYIVITLLMAPVLFGFGVPFLIAATIFYRAAASRLPAGWRLALASVIAGLGVAPSFDDYGGPLPIYVRIARGEHVSLTAALVSFVLTWVIMWALARVVTRMRASDRRSPASPTIAHAPPPATPLHHL
jgi:hypothetical protein